MLDLTNVDWGLFALWYVVFLFSLTVHEGAHALAALLGGDDTAYHGGQVTLNPLPHIRQEPMGTLLLPLLSYMWFGWVMGWASTPYDPAWAERYPRRAGLMSLAGPAANFVLAFLALVALRIFLATGVMEAPDSAVFHQVAVAAPGGSAMVTPLAQTLSILLVLNVLLGVFNLLPVPPLDGSGALAGFLPPRAADRYRELTTTGGLRLVGLLAAWMLFGRVIWPLFVWIVRLVHPGARYS